MPSVSTLPAERETFFNAGAMNGRLAGMQHRIDDPRTHDRRAAFQPHRQGRLSGRKGLLSLPRARKRGSETL
jgi:hypothetical protein